MRIDHNLGLASQPAPDTRKSIPLQVGGVLQPCSFANTAPLVKMGMSLYLFTVPKAWLPPNGRKYVPFVVCDFRQPSTLAPDEWMIVPFMVHGCG